MLSKLLARFARARFAGEQPAPAMEQVPLDQLATQAREARLLLESDAYVGAYQRQLDALVDELLSLDMGNPEGRDRAIALLSRCQQHQQIARDLAAVVRRHELEKDRRERARPKRFGT